MVIKNSGWQQATAFDLAIFIKNVNTGIEYEIDRINYSGLSYQVNQNEIPITNMILDLKNKPLVPSGTYRLQGRINDNKKAYETNYLNNTEYFGNQTFVYTASTIGINETPKTVSFVGNYPNPSTDFTNFKFSLTENAFTTLTIYDVTGKVITQIINDHIQSGEHIYKLDTSTLPNGIYAYSLKVNDEIVTKNFIISK